jgi:hypothetical protein
MNKLLVALGSVVMFVSVCAFVPICALGQSSNADTSPPTPPSYCHPCLFYGGDFDASNPNANASLNQDTFTGQAVTYVAFYVPEGQIWTVKGLFSNVLSTIQYIIPKQIGWSISSGVSGGNPGTLIASGTADATWTPTGRSWRGYTEYTALGRLTPDTLVTLNSGVYWMTAVPVCTQFGNGRCASAFYMVSDVEDVPAPNHKGIQPDDDAFLDDGSEFYYAPTWGPNGTCGGIGCDKFSAGLLGDAVPQ